MPTDDSVITRRDGRVGRIVLNRPNALNALDIHMIRALTGALETWRDEPGVHAVVVEGAGDRAFCAGGDIRAIRQFQMDGMRERVEAFFSEEYALNLMIATYTKPYVALIDGICMGGGIGVSVHGAYRAASDHALFAMPETAIGFLPDIGASHFLPRLPGYVGTYLALTGARLRGADAVHAGLATHFVPRERMTALSNQLARDGVAALAEHCEKPPPFSLGAHRAAIDRCFGDDTMTEIIRRLEAEGGDFARASIQTLRQMSPSSLVWSLRLLREGAGRTLKQCLEAELRATRTVTRHHEFLEGVRAMVVDKDRSPRWQPPRLEEVDQMAVESLLG